MKDAPTLQDEGGGDSAADGTIQGRQTAEVVIEETATESITRTGEINNVLFAGSGRHQIDRWVLCGGKQCTLCAHLYCNNTGPH